MMLSIIYLVKYANSINFDEALNFTIKSSFYSFKQYAWKSHLS